MIELSKNILQKSLNLMEENSYRNLCLMEKSVVNPFAYVYANDIDISKIFNASYNKNAKYIYFTRNEVKYLKFQLSVNLNNKQDEIDRKKKIFHNTKYELDQKKKSANVYAEFITLNERGLMNRNTLEVFINGKKIPDKRILVTLYSGSTDVYIPVRYFEVENPEITFVVNKYSNANKYYNSFSDKITSTLVKIPFLQQPNIKIDNLRIYLNGVLRTDFVFNEGDKTLDLTKLAIKEKDEVEFVYRILTQEYQEYIPENKVITFSKEVLKDKPIFSDINECYLNGIRQFPKDMTNVSPRNISLNNFEKGDTLTYYLCYDENFPSEENRYVDDLTQFFNYKHDDASKIINGEYEGFLPEYIKNINFPPEVIKVINEDKNKFSESFTEFLKIKTHQYIKQNVENFKYLLKNLKSVNTDFFYSYDYVPEHIRTDTSKELGELNYLKFSKEHVVFSFGKVSEKNMIIVLVNNEKIDDSKITKFQYKNTNYIYIDKDLFSEDCIIHILQFPVFNDTMNYIITKERDIAIEKSKLGYIQSMTDILVMRKSSDKGWYGFTDYTREELEDSVHIVINDSSEDEFIIFNSSFSSDRTYYVQKEDVKEGELTRIRFDLEKGDDYYPMASFYSPIIFRNNKLLSKDTDYKILLQYNNPVRTVADIIFAMQCSEGDKIDIITSEYCYESLGGVNYINSDYGVIYFDELVFPFDSGYIDLYVDGKLIPPEDIEVISAKMVKVNTDDNLINVGLRSKLSVPLYLLRDFMDTFIDNPSLWDEYVKGYWQSNYTDDFYLEWNPDGTKVRHDVTDDEIRAEILANEVARCLILGLIPRLIDCNKYYDFSQYHPLRELMTDKKDYIEINCNKEQLLKPCDINMTKHLKTLDEVVEAVNKVTVDSVLNANEDIPDDSPLWKEIYEDELEDALLN